MDSITINKKLSVSLLSFVQFIIVITPGSHSELMPIETSTKTLWPIGPIKYLTTFEAIADSQSHDVETDASSKWHKGTEAKRHSRSKQEKENDIVQVGASARVKKKMQKFSPETSFFSHEDALRRRLAPAPFQTCNQCTCCSGPNNQTCTTKPCCCGIKCNIPSKPFRTCAFAPKKCDCNPCN